jgi:hypothetical protein
MVVKERFVIPSFIVAYLIPISELVEILIGIYPTRVYVRSHRLIKIALKIQYKSSTRLAINQSGLDGLIDGYGLDVCIGDEARRWRVT